MKYYVVWQKMASGNGSSTDIFLIVKAKMGKSGYKGIKVGSFDASNTSDYVNHPMFTECMPVKAGYTGSVRCEEIDYYPFSKDVSEEFLQALEKKLDKPNRNEFKDTLSKLFNRPAEV